MTSLLFVYITLVTAKEPSDLPSESEIGFTENLELVSVIEYTR